MKLFSPWHGTHVHTGRRDPALRPSGQKPRLQFKDYVRGATAPAVQVPASYDWRTPAAAPALAGMHKNDVEGCCVIAYFANLRPTLTAAAGQSVIVVPDSDVDFYYGKIGGYVPGDPSTDQGCDEQTAIDYVTNTGFVDGVKLAGSVQVDGSNWQEVCLANYLFGNIMTGIGGPDEWFSPMPTPGSVWDVAGRANPANGHCTYGLGYCVAVGPTLAPPPSGRETLLAQTWGMGVYYTKEALAAYAVPSAGGELHANLDPDILMAAIQTAPTGIAWSDLLTDLSTWAGAPVSASVRQSIFEAIEDAVAKATRTVDRDVTTLTNKLWGLFGKKA
jgi:hypothetical protein